MYVYFKIKWNSLYFSKFLIYPTDTPRRIHLDSTWILRPYVEDQISTNFHVISVYFFNVISMVEKSTPFPRTFFDVILLVQKQKVFLHTFFRCNFDGRKIDVVSTFSFQCNLDGRIVQVVSTYFYWCNFADRKI